MKINKKIHFVLLTVLASSALFISKIEIKEERILASVEDDFNNSDKMDVNTLVQNPIVEEKEIGKNTNFFFREVQETIQVHDNLIVKIGSELPTSEVTVKIPNDAKIQEDILTEESVNSSDQEGQWILSKEQPTTTFNLPLSFDKPGEYVISIVSNENTTSKLIVLVEAQVVLDSQLIDSGEVKDTHLNEEKVVEEILQIKEITGNQVKEDPVTKNVNTWNDFKVAWNNPNVEVINLTENISGNENLSHRDSPITVNGGGHFLDHSRPLYLKQGANQSRFSNVTFSKAQINMEAESDATIFLDNITLNDLSSSTKFVALSGKYVIDGGINKFNSNDLEGRSVVFMSREVEITNGAIVISNESELLAASTDTPNGIELIFRMNGGSKLDINKTNESATPIISTNALILQGKDTELNLNTSGIAISRRGSIQKLDIDIKSGASFYLSSGNANTAPLRNISSLKIDEQSNFNIINIAGGPVIQSNVATVTTRINTNNLAIWNIGRENKEFTSPSQNFLNLEAEWTGSNSKIITHVNNNVFRSTYSSLGWAGYSRISNIGISNELPIDPLNPEIDANPENKPEIPSGQGNLRIDFASQFNFASQKISLKDETYFSTPQKLLNEAGEVTETDRPNFIQITDNRSDMDGWQLSVTQTEQFKTEDAKELSGAQLGFYNQEIIASHEGKAPEIISEDQIYLIPGNRKLLLEAKGDEGKGTWVYRFGNGDTSGESVQLEVPKEALPNAASYTTTFKWELSAVPRNQ